MIRSRPIEGSTVVVVGATSGVGRATALSLAARRARLVIVARTAADVEETAEACRELGAAALAVAADIGRAEDVERIVDQAVAHFGWIDTWINTAAVLVVGELHQQPVEEIEQIMIIATNVLGTTLASRAAVLHFRAREAGVLINLSSLLGAVPNPIVPTYTMTKYAVRGLSLSLDQATFGRSGRGLRVCTVLPGPIDTPMFARAVNVAGVDIRAIPPAFSPERVAATVIRSVRRPRRQRTTGVTGALIVVGLHVAPRLTETIVAQLAARLITRSPRRTVRGDTGVFALRRNTASGGWRRGRARAAAGDGLGRLLARRY